MSRTIAALSIALLLTSTAIAQEAPAPAAPPVPPKQLTGSEKVAAELPLAWWQAIQQSLLELPGKVGNPINNELDKQLTPQVQKLQFPDKK